MNKTQAKWEKSEILDLYKKNRSRKRCEIVCGLKSQADALTKDLRTTIKELETEISVLLETNNLTSFQDDRYTCTPNKHKSLVDFDKVTDRHTQQIINGTFEGSVTD